MILLNRLPNFLIAGSPVAGQGGMYGSSGQSDVTFTTSSPLGSQQQSPLLPSSQLPLLPGQLPLPIPQTTLPPVELPPSTSTALEAAEVGHEILEGCK